MSTMEEVIKILSFFGLAEQAVVTATCPIHTMSLCLLYATPDLCQGSVPDGFIIHGGGPE